MALGSHALTTVARVKSYLAPKVVPVSAEDTKLEMMIDQASGRIEMMCDRHFETATYTAELHLTRGGLEVRFRHWPVTSITSISESTDGETWTVVASTDYAINRDATGAIRWDGWLDGRFAPGLSVARTEDGPPNLKVTYVAGYVLPQAGSGITLPADLEGACIEWVIDAYLHADKIGLASEAFEGMSTTYQAIPPRVASVLARYARVHV